VTPRETSGDQPDLVVTRLAVSTDVHPVSAAASIVTRPDIDRTRRVTADPQRTRLPERNLDILRATAVLCVLADHTMGSWDSSLGPLLSNWTLGRLGVLFFFVHTALVLMSSLERQGTARPHWIRSFYIRRTFRIYPLAIASVVIYVVFSLPYSVSILGVSGPAAPLNVVTVATNLTLTQNLTGSPNIVGQLWSLPLEVQMYLLLPLCFLIARRSATAVAGLVGALVVLGVIVHWSGVRGVWRLSVFEFGPCFAGGVLAYHLARRRIRRRAPAWMWPLAILVAGALFVALSATSAEPYRGWLPCLFLGACIPFFSDTAESAVTRAAHRICDVSYGLYLLHVVALWIAFVALRRTPLLVEWTAYAALIVAMPYAAFRFLEKPCMRLGTAIVGGHTSKAAEVGAP
jgi:peptidoglycan/LPS O-acetylase OafA/YrhL